jgi:ATP synthase I chain
MKLIADSVNGGPLAPAAEHALEERIFRAMLASVTIAAGVAAIVAPWRVATGLTLGGALSLANYHWMRSSIMAMLNVDIAVERPQVKTMQYVLRYFIVATTVFAAYQLRLVSLPAMLVGLCSFVPAFLFEAFRQFWLIIIHREESY